MSPGDTNQKKLTTKKDENKILGYVMPTVAAWSLMDMQQKETKNENLIFVSTPEEKYADKFSKYAFSAILGLPSQQVTASKDLETMKSVITSITQAKNENILTESEAEVMLEFVFSKYVERRFTGFLQKIVEVETPGNFNFTGFTGRIE